jgi:ribosome biogenesis GTPase / thiamine phosphate phosphatase
VSLSALGWDERFAADFAPWASRPDVCPGRVLIEFNHIYRVAVRADRLQAAQEGGPPEGGPYEDLAPIHEIEATLAGRMKHLATSRGELPAVGDWVAVRIRPREERGAIVGVLPRRSRFSRRMAGQVTDEQVVAANADVVFIVMALDADYSLRRLERYLLLTHDSGASPVVLLTKPDLCDDVAARVAETLIIAGNAPVHVVSAPSGLGVDDVAAYLAPGRTGAFLGSSGVGKSSIINRLAGADRQRTREVREADSKGRHTTTHRELITLPSGGLVIDTPGMRELQLWDAGAAVRGTFEDVEGLVEQCHFTDCRHREEPRCAVKAAVADGRIAVSRLESYHKLQDELAHLTRQQDQRAMIEEKRKAKVIGKAAAKHIKAKRGE